MEKILPGGMGGAGFKIFLMQLKWNNVFQFLVIASTLYATPIFGQVANFTIKSPICKYEEQILSNTSTGATSYQWDFSFGDLDSIVTTTSSSVVIPGDFPIDAQIQYDKGQWFGFTSDFLSSKLYRLEYGNSLTNSPAKIELGDLGILSFPSQTRLYLYNNVWYGFVVNYVGNKLVRLTFGNGLGSFPTLVENLDSFSTISAPMGLEIVNEAGDFTIVVANSTSNVLSLIHFGNSLTNTPTNADVIEVGSGVGFTGMGRVSVKKFNGEWYGLVCSVNDSKVYRVRFGSTVFDASTNFDLVGSVTNPEGVDLVEEGGKYYGFVASRASGINKIDFGGDITGSGQIVSLGKFGLTDEFRSLEVVRDSPGWRMYTFSRNGGILSRIDFNDRGTGTPLAPSILLEPTGVKYNKSGVFKVELTATAATGTQAISTSSVTVLNSQAPDIDFNTLNKCVSNSNIFSAVNNSADISSYSWDFNNDGTEDSNVANPNYQFATPGNYPVSLKVANVNGCTNLIQKSINIYAPPPSPAFSFTPQPLCTKSSFNFTNNTNETGYDNSLTYEWSVDGTMASNAHDFTTSFESIKTYDVSLKSLLTGCSSETIQSINITMTGPTVGFSPSGQCVTDQILFTNTSSGSISSYAWNFGNGNTSIDTNPTQVYPNKGTYSVSLKAESPNGCASILSKNLIIYSKPQPTFSLELPPFSCSGTPSQFTNTTVNPTDSNVTSWLWNFGDGNNSTSNLKDPLFTYSQSGNFNISLAATTNFGCTATATQSVTIAQGPPIDFTNTAACLNQGTRFADASGADIKSWSWAIENSTYAFSTPTHVFSNAGSYDVRLTVTGNNNCIATLVKQINVPVKPTLDFSYSNACSAAMTIFQDTSPLAKDPVASQSWDFAGNAKTGSPAEYSFSTAGTYAVKMTSTQQSGCVYSISKNVVIAAAPVAKFSASPEWGVSPLNVQFTNQSTGASSYSWRFNDKNGSTSTQLSPTFQFTDLGDYVVDLTAMSDQGCSSSFSSKISVIVPSLDVELKKLDLIKDPTSGTYRMLVTIKNKSNFVLTSADVIVSLSGSAQIKETINTTILPDGEVSQLLNNQILPSSLFTYLCAELDVPSDVDLFNNKKCESVSDEGVVFSPYPNPSNGAFQFDWISVGSATAHFAILNSMGQVVFQQDVTVSESGLNQMTFDLRAYNEGYYFFKFTSNSLSKTIPIVIAR